MKRVHLAADPTPTPPFCLALPLFTPYRSIPSSRGRAWFNVEPGNYVCWKWLEKHGYKLTEIRKDSAACPGLVNRCPGPGTQKVGISKEIRPNTGAIFPWLSYLGDSQVSCGFLIANTPVSNMPTTLLYRILYVSKNV